MTPPREEKKKRVLYLDLDGTTRKGFDELGKFVNKAEDVEIFPEMGQIIHEFKLAGWRIVGITNQGGVSLGHLSFKEMSDAIQETNRQARYGFDKIMACIHHPEAKDKEFAVCWCRKPRIGLVVEAALRMSEQFDGEYYPPHLAAFIGDREEDKQCAEAANIRFMDAKEFRTGGWKEIITSKI